MLREVNRADTRHGLVHVHGGEQPLGSKRPGKARKARARAFPQHTGLALKLAHVPLLESSTATFTMRRLTEEPDAPGSSTTQLMETSIMIFRRHIQETRDAHGRIHLDASQVTSRECFEEWKEGRRAVGGFEKEFQRSLTAHLTRSDGRQPFEPDVEAAILQVVRTNEVWPAFLGTDIKIGTKGFRTMGYHEREKAPFPV
jgi:hypothetical protein